MSQILFVGNSNDIEISGLRNEATGSIVTGATITARVLDSSGDPIDGQEWPLALPAVSGEPGTYRGQVSHAAELVARGRYTIQIDISGGGMVAALRVPAVALTRT